MKPTLDLRILQVSKTHFTGPATSVVVKTSNGVVTILPDHTPFISPICPCTVQVTTDKGSVHQFEAKQGIIEMVRNTCTLLL